MKAPAPAPQLKHSPRNSPGGKAEAAWEARWHKPGRLKAVGTDSKGEPLNLHAAEPYADFVQVFILERNQGDRHSWVGLRANGKIVWSDGTLETGTIGLARAWGDVQPIRYGGMVEPRAGLQAPPVPVTNFLFGKMAFLPGRPWATAWTDVDGVWHVDSPAFAKGLLKRPDLTTPPKITQVIVDTAGIGVLREDGTLRIWNRDEMKLPETIGKDVLAVTPMGNSWAVLKKEGRVLNFGTLKLTTSGAECVVEPISIRRFLESAGAPTALAGGGFSPLVKHADGHWSTAPSLGLINETLAKLHKTGNQSFDAFSSMDKQGVMWIEPAE
jgi:hypothetical protein